MPRSTIRSFVAPSEPEPRVRAFRGAALRIQSPSNEQTARCEAACPIPIVIAWYAAIGSSKVSSLTRAHAGTCGGRIRSVVRTRTKQQGFVRRIYERARLMRRTASLRPAARGVVHCVTGRYSLSPPERESPERRDAVWLPKLAGARLPWLPHVFWSWQAQEARKRL